MKNDIDSSGSADDFDDEITDLDFSAYAQGLLSEERQRRVRQLLQDHPELKSFATEPSSPWSSISDDQDVPIAHPESSDLVSVASETSQVSDSVAAPQATGKAIRRVSQGLGLTAAGLLICSTVLFFARQSLADRISRFESRIQQQSENIGATDVRNLQLELLELGDSMFLSESIDRRRRILLARLYLLQLKTDIDLLQFAADPDLGDSTVALGNDLIDLIRSSYSRTQLEAELLSEAYLTKSHLLYLLGSIKVKWEDRVECMSSSAMAAANALELLQEVSLETRNRMYVPTAALLVRAMYKGGIVNGIEPNSRLRAICNELRGRPTDYSLDSLIPEMTELFLREPAETVDAKIARIDLYSVVGMWAANSQQDGLQVEYGLKLYRQGTSEERLMKRDAELNRSPHFLLNAGKLYGNQADLLTNMGRIDEAIESRYEAIKLLRKSLAERRSNVTIYELGWVTCRQLLVEYVHRTQEKQDLGVCRELLGGAMTLSNDMQDFSGMQLGRNQEIVLPIIAADLKQDVTLLPSASYATQVLDGLYESRKWHHSATETIADAQILQQAPELQLVLKEYLDRSRVTEPASDANADPQ